MALLRFDHDLQIAIAQALRELDLMLDSHQRDMHKHPSRSFLDHQVHYGPRPVRSYQHVGNRRLVHLLAICPHNLIPNLNLARDVRRAE